jgi:hypothetical protein
MDIDLYATPILLIIFNRPETTARVFEAIRMRKPSFLYIAADGPRENKPGEKKLCESARKIVEAIDWPCEVKRLYQNKNLGCKIGVSTAISWFFNQVQEGIILEDDCLPNESFFAFCAQMLERYRFTDSVMAINGTSMLTHEELGNPIASYHFSRCLHVWGWATWERAWKKYDMEMKNLDQLLKNDFAQSLFLEKKSLIFWIRHFRHIRDKNIDTWDAQWHYSILKANGLIISPHSNMVENIGFGPDATHTFNINPHALLAERLEGAIVDPKLIQTDMKVDDILMKKIYMRNIWQKIISRIRS